MEEKINLAIVGCGGMANAHASGINAEPLAQVVALCDVNRANMERLRDKFPNKESIKLYDSYEALLKNPPEKLRGIMFVTPHTQHFQQAMSAIEHGYDVLVEKPMVTNSDHARKLAEKLKATGRQLQVGFQAPFSAEFAYIRDVLKNNGLGELQTITAFSCQGWRNGTLNSWRQDPAMSGGGQMYDTGAHLFNSVAWLIDRPAEEVFCWTDKKGTPVDINAAITIRFQGNVLGTVTISGNTPGWQEGIWLAGDKGRIVTGIHAARLEHYDEKGALIKYPQVTQKGYTPIGNFVQCIAGKAEPRCGVRYGVLHSWLMDALYQSDREGRPVKLSAPPLD